MSAATTTDADTGPARVIVKLKASSALLQQEASGAAQSGTRMARLGRRVGLSVSDGPQVGARIHVAKAQGLTSRALAAQLAQQSDVEYAVPDKRRRAFTATPNDTLYASGQASPYPAAGQWYAHAADATLVSAINAPTAWGLITGSSSVVVAVVDTGVRFDHADLAANLLPGYNFISDAAAAGNSVGRSSDASDLGDYLLPSDITANPSVFSGCTAQTTSSWHGTQVSGLIGADTNNSLGIAGIGWNVRILPVRVLGKCGGYDSDIIAGMRWAAGLSVSGAPANPHPAQIINLSLGSTDTCSQAYLDAISEINATGALIVAAAGNESVDVSTPANCSGVVAVAAVRHSGTKVGYSSLGSSVAISAPGGNCVNSTGSCVYPMISTTNSGTTTPVTDANGGSTYTDANTSDAALGTSFATPLVSGTAALMRSANSTLTPAQLTALLKSTARAFPTNGGTAGIVTCTAPTSTAQDECYCTTSTCGAGLLDAGAAVAAAATLSPLITISPSAPTYGETITLSAANTVVPAGDSIVSYQWTLLNGGGIVTSLSSSTGVSVTTSASAAGTFSVQVTVQTNNGATASTTSSVAVSAPTRSSTGVAITNPSGSGGGGAVDATWLLLLGGGLAGAARLARPTLRTPTPRRT